MPTPILKPDDVTYLISRGVAAYLVGFSLVWFGGIVGFVIVGQLPHEHTPANIGAMVGATLVALAPAVATALISYRVTVSEDGMCAFRSLLRERTLRANQINSIDWDDDYMLIRHESGKTRVLLDPMFKPLLTRLLELNPTIRVSADLLSSLDDPR